MKKKICIISLSHISRDGRVLRQVEYLAKGHHLLVVGYGNPPPDYASNPDVEWISLPYPPKFAGLIQRLFERFIIIPLFPKLHPAYKILMYCDCGAIHVNNWDSLPMAAEASRQRNLKLVLDIHESYDSWYWGLTATMIKRIFIKYARYVSFSTTVVDALAEQHQLFGLSPIIVMNAPNFNNLPDHKPTKEPITLIHHGAADPSRHLEVMIETLALCDPRYSLSFMLVPAQSKYIKQLMELAKKIAPGRVTFLEPVAPADITQRISSFDIGFYPLKPTTFNQRIALPNKFFDFLSAGLAVCIGPSPSMANIVNNYGCGIVTPSFDPHDLSDALNRMTSEEWDEMKKASRNAAGVLNAENEMEKVLNIYRKLFELKSI